MTPAEIMALVSGLLQAAPMLLDLFNRASSGQAVTQAEVDAILNKFTLDRAQFVADIAKAP